MQMQEQMQRQSVWTLSVDTGAETQNEQQIHGIMGKLANWRILVKRKMIKGEEDFGL